MLSPEFAQETGALVRRLEGRIRNDPVLQRASGDDLMYELEDAIVMLCALYFKLQKAGVEDVG